MRVARQISHPNVCRVYDIGEVDGAVFLSMEYVDGEDLASLLRRIGRLPPDKGLEIARKLCAGLAAAHEKGVLHRDLKPANVMLDARGQLRLTDFGLAGLAEDISGADVRSGTPAYMAPEQLAGKEATTRSDIYALGLVLYELFTGKRPHESSSLPGAAAAPPRGGSRAPVVVRPGPRPRARAGDSAVPRAGSVGAAGVRARGGRRRCPGAIRSRQRSRPARRRRRSWWQRPAKASGCRARYALALFGCVLAGIVRDGGDGGADERARAHGAGVPARGAHPAGEGRHRVSWL